MQAIKPSEDAEIPLNEIKDNTWPEIIPLPVTKLAEVMSLEPEWLPEPLRDWIVDNAERAGCPIDYIAIPAIVAMAALIGRKYVIYPKEFDDWYVVPNLWGMIIGRPSSMKSPALSLALAPLMDIESRARKAFEIAQCEYEADTIMAKCLVENAVENIKKASKGQGSELSEAKAGYMKLKEAEPIKPTPKRLIVNDSTVEKLGELLNENPNGLVVVRDELSGLLKSLDRVDRGSDRSFYLECFNGAGDFTFDRIGRGTIYIESTTLSIIGGIQPGKIKFYIANAIKQGAGDDGLIQRFQLMVYPDENNKPWVNVDRAPNMQAMKKALSFFNELYELIENSPSDCQSVRFSREGQSIFNDWRCELEDKVNNPDMHPVLQSHFAKYRSLMPTLALINHLAANDKSISVSEEAALKAYNLCSYFESHAYRIYGMGVNLALDNAQLILNRRNKLPHPFKPRDINNKNWVGLDDGKTIELALEVLLDHGYLKEEIVKTGGRDSKRYWWNPNI